MTICETGKVCDFTENTETNKTKPKMGAYEALQRNLNVIEMFGKVIGLSLIYEWKSGPKFWFSVFYLFFTWTQFIYSQVKFFIDGEEKRIFEVFAAYGIAVSCTLKVKCYVNSFKELTAMHKFSLKLCRLNSDNPFLQEQQIQNTKISKMFYIMCFISMSFYLFYPIKCFVYNRELVPLSPIEIMFIDQSKVSGFLVANFLTMLMGVYALLGTLYMGSHLITYILNYSMQVDIIGTHRNELQ
ncbi:hypothetical protein Bhyg_13497 [Pseudolycoriella hygida]|uniref:Uncharacterized protein n=1 Tax=Pseudolycoriella hygida TaxID=35572 RepID=A0A9Q0RWD9_9DIPT|nr:hypothetical protein Bhyg_13497 [Pseudolycoriella hygida]